MRVLGHVDWRTVGRWILGIGVAQVLRIAMAICCNDSYFALALFFLAIFMFAWGCFCMYLYEDGVVKMIAGYYTFGSLLFLIIDLATTGNC